MDNLYKSIILFYFSGTGNTKILANIYSKELRGKDCNVKIYAIEDLLKGKIKIQTKSFDIMGLGYPIHAFNAPRIVFDFIKTLPISNDMPCFIFKCPGDSFIKAGSTSMIRNSLRKSGYLVFHEDLILMPANVFLRYGDELSKELYEVAKRKIKRFADEILAGKEKLQDNGLGLRLITWVISWIESNGAHLFGKFLKVSDSCDRCMLCTKICPTSNISLQGDRIKFGEKCVLCMRCIYKCPNNSIFPRFLKFFVLKEGYDIDRLIKNVKSNEKYLFEEKDGFTKRLYHYVNDLD